MFILIVLGVIAVAASIAAIHSVVTDGYHRAPARAGYERFTSAIR
jgi:hypothetical protein